MLVRIDLCQARPVTLTEQIDAGITQPDASSFHILDYFRDGIAGQVHPFDLETGRAVFHGIRHLGTVQLWRAIHPTVADHDEIMVCQKPDRR